MRTCTNTSKVALRRSLHKPHWKWHSWFCTLHWNKHFVLMLSAIASHTAEKKEHRGFSTSFSALNQQLPLKSAFRINRTPPSTRKRLSAKKGFLKFLYHHLHNDYGRYTTVKIIIAERKWHSSVSRICRPSRTDFCSGLLFRKTPLVPNGMFPNANCPPDLANVGMKHQLFLELCAKKRYRVTLYYSWL